MIEKTRLQLENVYDYTRQIALSLRTLEASAIHLNELFHFFDSALIRRPPWRPARAERIQQLIARLRSIITQAAIDIGLQRVIQDPNLEAASLLGLMKESIQRHSDLDDQNKPPAGLDQYVSELESDCRQIVEEINTAIGSNSLDGSAIGGEVDR